MLHLVPTWHEKGAKFPVLDWPEYQLFEKELIQTANGTGSSQVPGSEEKGARLLAKKSYYIIAILSLTSQPAGIDQLMEWMAYKKKQSFRELYLVPLQKAGLISKTNPEKKKTPIHTTSKKCQNNDRHIRRRLLSTLKPWRFI